MAAVCGCGVQSAASLAVPVCVATSSCPSIVVVQQVSEKPRSVKIGVDEFGEVRWKKMSSLWTYIIMFCTAAVYHCTAHPRPHLWWAWRLRATCSALSSESIRLVMNILPAKDQCALCVRQGHQPAPRLRLGIANSRHSNAVYSGEYFNPSLRFHHIYQL